MSNRDAAGVGPGGSSLPAPFGRYQIERLLGRGAMGAVYLALDSQLGRRVALKIPQFAEDEAAELLERFLREARSAAQLNHPHVCPVYDVGRVDGWHYITMAYIEGKPLSDLVGHGRPLPEKTAVVITRKIGLGLVHAHANGIVHRDLKPANVMVDKRREPLIMDFGLAARMDSRAETRMTREGTILGTPAYMSPEQVLGDVQKTGPQSDVFSLGVMLYEMLTGRLPFTGTATEVLAQIVREDPEPPSRHRGELDPHLEMICLTMMARSTTERYASMLQAVQALADWGREKPAAGRSDSFEDFDRLLEPASPARPGSTAPRSSVSSRKAGSSAARAATVRMTDDAASKSRSRASLFAAAGVLAFVAFAAGLIWWLGRRDIALQVVIDEDAVRKGAVVELDDRETIAGFGRTVALKRGRHRAAVEVGDSRFETEEFEVASGQPGVFNVGWTGDSPTASLDGRPVAIKGPPTPAGAAAHSGGGARSNPSTVPGPVFAEAGLSLPADIPVAVAPFDAEKASQHQDAWAEGLKAPKETTNSVGMKLRLIPPGEYQMGTSDEEVRKLSEEWLAAGGDSASVRLALVDETPQHRVRIPKPFYIGAHEVTVWQFRQFLDSTRYQSDSDQFGGIGIQAETGESTQGGQFSWRAPGYAQGDDHPVGLVSWYDAQEFCAWLSRREGRTYRLPTEEEWEYAARAGSHDRWSFGDQADHLAQYANVMDQSYVTARTATKTIENDRHFAANWKDGAPYAAAVGSLQPNAFGLFDVSGNLLEWCSDLYRPVGYRTTAADTGMTVPSPFADRSTRGGSWGHGPLGVRSGARHSSGPSTRSAAIGFRVICEWQGEPPNPRAVNPTPPLAYVGPPQHDALSTRPTAQSLEYRGSEFPKGGLIATRHAHEPNPTSWPTKLPPSCKRYAVEVVARLSGLGLFRLRNGDESFDCNLKGGIIQYWGPRGTRVFRFTRYEQSDAFRTLTFYFEGRHVWAMIDDGEWSGPIQLPEESTPGKLIYGVMGSVSDGSGVPFEGTIASFRTWDLSDLDASGAGVAAQTNPQSSGARPGSVPVSARPSQPEPASTLPGRGTVARESSAASDRADVAPPLDLAELRKLKPVLVEDFDGARGSTSIPTKNGRFVYTGSGTGTSSRPHRVDELHLSREFALEISGRVDRPEAQWGLAFQLGRYLGMVMLDGEGKPFFHDRFGLSNPVPLKMEGPPEKKELHTLLLQVRGRAIHVFVDGRPAASPLRLSGDVSTSDFWFVSNATDGGSRTIEVDRLTLWALPPTPTPAVEMPRELTRLQNLAPAVDESFDSPTRGVGKAGDYQAGRFLIRGDGVVHRAVSLDAKWPHFAFEAVGRSVGRKDDSWGLQLRLADKSHCTFLVDRFGGLSYLATEKAEPAILAVPGHQERPGAHRLTLEIHGNRVTPYVNGVASEPVTLKGPAQPTTVAFVSGKETTVGSEFESFRAWKLSETPLEAK